MVKKCPTCNKTLDSFLPFRCRRCNLYYCNEHRLPENHNCQGVQYKNKDIDNWIEEEKKFKKHPEIKSTHIWQKKNPIRTHHVSKDSSKKPLYKHNNKLVSWFFWKKYPNSRIYRTDLLVQIAFVVCLSFIFMFIYSNSDKLNEITLWIFKLGSTIAFVVLLVLLWYFYKLLKNLKYGFKGLANGYKLITALICVFICLQIYLTPSLIIDPVMDFDYDSLNPIALGNISWSDIGIDTTPILSPEEIKSHPNKYLGQRVIVEGYYLKGTMFLTPNAVSSIKTPSTEGEAMEMLINMLPIIYEGNVSLFDGARYRFTGVVTEGEIFDSSYVYLDVEKVVPL